MRSCTQKMSPTACLRTAGDGTARSVLSAKETNTELLIQSIIIKINTRAAHSNTDWVSIG
jgi:hypothetical protein